MNPKEIAQAYENAISEPDNEAVRIAYRSFVKQCRKQFRRIPVKVVFTPHDPYKTSSEMILDCFRGVLKVFTGGNKHPVMTDEENAVFRACHDWWGHFIPRASFSYKGELKAWRAHRRMFTGDAVQVLNSETIGQASVYFHGSRPKTFAEQKAILMKIPLDKFGFVW